MTTKYIHLIDKNMTIGYQIDDANQRILYAVSFKNPRDTYNKKIGRRIVDGRLAKDGVSKITGRENHTAVSFAELNNDISYKNIVSYFSLYKNMYHILVKNYKH